MEAGEGLLVCRRLVEISRLVDDDDDDMYCAGGDVLFDFPLGSWTSNGEDRRTFHITSASDVLNDLVDDRVCFMMLAFIMQSQ